jgi:NTP pyrophosphatase (non-canonical NTP hydrolase)
VNHTRSTDHQHPFVIALPAGGRWEPCTPELLWSGVDCATTLRRAALDADRSHDHWIVDRPEQSTAHRVSTGDLRQHAATIADQLRRHGFDPATAAGRQVLALAEECGEFVGAYRRWSGQARRTGTRAEMAAELADVVLVAFVTAEELGVDLDTEITAKLADMFTRGWRDTSTTDAQ